MISDKKEGEGKEKDIGEKREWEGHNGETEKEKRVGWGDRELAKEGDGREREEGREKGWVEGQGLLTH